jgi:hypothetical protein
MRADNNHPHPLSTHAAADIKPHYPHVDADIGFRVCSIARIPFIYVHIIKFTKIRLY